MTRKMAEKEAKREDPELQETPVWVNVHST